MNPLEAFIKGLTAKRDETQKPEKPKEKEPPKGEANSPSTPPQQPAQPDSFQRGIDELKRRKQGFAAGGPVPGTPPADPTKDNVDIKARSGEFVIPEDVVRWYGLKYFESLLSRAQAEMAGGGMPPSENQFVGLADDMLMEGD